ncbi:aspartyl beta-hydroxylase [Pseudoalteromonas rubra]|uniref:Aspartyl beta-hydroxylase n=1 Tax=Pseudoalteromonas rubra TaxID=43658 RepID=A0A5S3WNY5_9GAMM|nr:aspartyl/asparaginyl beta-hydroxylase domain-containing protein [Pseudoalteromonas rubra]TMP29973.1 aspartyl beta-hydroxylase [Pseudoalteromonas rubra]TMP32201.1 aspartyl beta-hydroxylase [Pseudoalteromonas rubra]
MNKEQQLELVPKQFRKHPIFWLITYKMAEKFNRVFSKYGNSPYLNKDNFEWTKPIEENADAINKELHAFLYDEVIPSIHEIDVNWKPAISDDRWKSFFLVGYGRPAEENCQRCPITYDLVKDVPGLVSAFFSVLKPGAKIPPHRGPFNGVLTYHMGLKLPKDRDQCFIKVDKKKYVWEYGEGVVFDDTYVHEVENNTDEIRVILMLNFARPVHSPFSKLCNYVLKCISELPFVERGYQKLVDRDYADVEKFSKPQ